MQTIVLLAVKIFIILQLARNAFCNTPVNLTAANRIVNGKEADLVNFPYQVVSIQCIAVFKFVFN